MGQRRTPEGSAAREIIGRMEPFSWSVPVYGLTGSIGSGKSELGRLLVERGADLIDADRVGHELLRKGRACHRRVVELFGSRILSARGGIDRGKLAAIVFGDTSSRGRLECILHPEILRSIDRRVRLRSGRGARIVVIEAALLYESGMDRFVDDVIVVVTRADVQLRRLVGHRGMQRAEATRRMDAQWDPARKAASARWVIENDGTLADLEVQARRLWARLGHQGPER